jgi:hypothetical protein
MLKRTTMAGNPDPSTSRTVLVGFVGTVLLFVIVVALQALYYTTERSEFEKKVLNEVPEELASLRAKQVENLNAYRWVEKASGVVAIPIDRAMQIIVSESQQPPAAAPSNITPSTP